MQLYKQCDIIILSTFLYTNNDSNKSGDCNKTIGNKTDKHKVSVMT